MYSTSEKLLLYEYYFKNSNMLNDEEEECNDFANKLNFNYFEEEKVKRKEQILQKKNSIIIYKKNEYNNMYNNMYITYIMFCSVIFQLIIGENKVNTFFL